MKYILDFDYKNIDNGIEYLKNNEIDYYPDNNERIIYHVYWYGVLRRKQILCIKSYLATQDLNNTELWVWLDNDFLETMGDEEGNECDKINKSISKYENIKIKTYNSLEESKGTLLENFVKTTKNKNLKFKSDIARVLFLHNYGGIYYDLDMILLKDLKPLLGIEFCYSWSNRHFGNNGILRIKKGSDFSKQLIQKYSNVVKNKNFVIWYNSFIFTEELDIMCLPCVMFDPVWILLDTRQKSKYSKLSDFDSFFKGTDENIDNFFGNEIFAYHWHSRLHTNIEKDSYFERLEKMIMRKIN